MLPRVLNPFIQPLLSNLQLMSCTSATSCCAECRIKDNEIRRLQQQVRSLQRRAGEGAGREDFVQKVKDKLDSESRRRCLKDSFSQMKNRLGKTRERRRCLVAWRTAAKTSKVFRGLVINARAEQASRRRNHELARVIFMSLRNAQSNRRQGALEGLQHSLM
jgi:hypothetical protein